MRNLKIHCNSLRCPHCGSAKYKITNGDIFICEYCGEKFNFELEKLDFSAENKIYIEELKEEFSNKVLELYEMKKRYHLSLMKYKKCAYPKKLYCFSIIFLIFSIFTFLASVSNYSELASVLTYSITGIFLGVFLLIVSKLRNKKMFQKYEPFVLLYAKKIVNCQEEIDAYTKIISRLTI